MNIQPSQQIKIHHSNFDVRLIVKLIITFLSCLSLLSCQYLYPKQGQRYDLKGKVISVDKYSKQVTIAHEEIVGYMPAMAMPFKLKDAWPLDVLAPGDKIQATLIVADKSSWLEDVAITKETSDPQSAANAEGLAEPKVGDEVKDFSLINQDGKPIHLQQYKGRALLLTFIYTRCPLPEYCTLMSNQFAAIDQQLQKNPALYDKTHLLSISFDPEHDKPEVLRSYGAAHTGQFSAETFSHWEFATGSPQEVKDIAQFFGLRYFQDSDQIVHSLRTAIIAPDGRIWKIYNGNEWRPDEVMSDLQSLLTSNKQ
jgi:protein SCO1/2